MGLIQDNCFLSDDDDDDVLALPLSANLDEEVQKDETDMFKKLIAEGEKSVPVRLFLVVVLQRRRMYSVHQATQMPQLLLQLLVSML